jgi:hypothetical protein
MEEQKPIKQPRFVGIILIAAVLLVVLFFEWIITKLTS